ncbi:MAG: lactate/malate family dehydrogenase, partial [Hyphomicrobiaceae bacterium]
MDLAIIGAAGSCGRQLAVQLLDERVMRPTARLQLVGHHGGRSEDELWGVRADLRDAFVDDAPTIDLVFDPEAIRADIVVMLAGATVSTDPNASADRAALGRENRRIFQTYADALARCPGPPPIVIVQSNPVELGVQIFAEKLGRHRVLGAGAWSDTLRFRGEIAAELGIGRRAVHVYVLGQHGLNLVPIWSQLNVRGVEQATVREHVHRFRLGRSLSEFPGELRAHMAHLLELVRTSDVGAAYDFVQSLTPDLRMAVKPFFIHYTSGRTTEIATAHAVADIASPLIRGEHRIRPAQVALDGEWLGIRGVIAAPILLGLDGWERVHPMNLDEDEEKALVEAAGVIEGAIQGAMAD